MELYTQNNLSFLAGTIRNSKDSTFRLFYANADRINTVFGTKDFCYRVIDVIVDREEVNSRIYQGGQNGQPFQGVTDNPDWTTIFRKIADKYDTGCAERVVLWAKIKWFDYKKDWTQYSTSVIQRVEKYGPYSKFTPYSFADNPICVNSTAWEIFERSNNPEELNKALGWSHKTLTDSSSNISYSEFLDTYANLLYKLGHKEEALNYEEKALVVNPGASDILKNMDRIKKGEPTWPTK